MLTRSLAILTMLFGLVACGAGAPFLDALDETVTGTTRQQRIDPTAAARAAAGQAFIERGMQAPDPNQAQIWINMGIGLLR